MPLRHALLISFLIHFCCISAQTVYIDKAISASDHNRKRPLEEALEFGFNGISAELELRKDGKLYCGSGTLRERYLEPLRLRSDNGSRFIHPDHQDEFLLLFDVTSDSIATFTALKKEIADFQPMLTSFEGNKRTKKPVRLVIGGKVPRQQMYSESVRWIFAEEVITKPDYARDISYCTVSSLRMKKLFDWKGEGNMPNMQFHSLGSYFKNAHKAGRWVRVYDLPEVPNAFEIIYGAGADILEIKDLKGFAEYWKNRKPY